MPSVIQTTIKKPITLNGQNKSNNKKKLMLLKIPNK
jgi:hypothetical protein